MILTNEQIQQYYQRMHSDPRSKTLITNEAWFVAGAVIGATHVESTHVTHTPTTRDTLAAQFLVAVYNAEMLEGARSGFKTTWREDLCKEAYRLADIMLEVGKS